MDRKKLIDRLVDRKLACSGKAKTLCVAGLERGTTTNRKK
jgi:hypothetical protein